MSSTSTTAYRDIDQAVGELRSVVHRGRVDVLRVAELVCAMPPPHRARWARYAVDVVAHGGVWSPGLVERLARKSQDRSLTPAHRRVLERAALEVIGQAIKREGVDPEVVALADASLATLYRKHDGELSARQFEAERPAPSSLTASLTGRTGCVATSTHAVAHAVSWMLLERPEAPAFVLATPPLKVRDVMKGPMRRVLDDFYAEALLTAFSARADSSASQQLSRSRLRPRR
ncbi:MAG: hypothetical protein AAGI01_00550 [Myxococcota bacterium]